MTGSIIRKGYNPAIDSYSAFFENDHKTPTGLAGYLQARGITRLTLTGLALAALGLFLSQSTGDESWDGIASVGIGVVLTIVAFLLGLQARNLLIGASAGKEVRDAIDDCLRGFPEVERVVRLLTMQLGAHSVLVNGELQLRRNITLDEAEDLLRRLDAQLAEGVPEVVDTFWELRGP